MNHMLTMFLLRYGAHGSKVTRHISFSERLDLRPYMSMTQSSSVLYRLYAVLVHNGCSTNSGHYYCYVRAPGGMWHCMNDSSVSIAVAVFLLSLVTDLFLKFFLVPVSCAIPFLLLVSCF